MPKHSCGGTLNLHHELRKRNGEPRYIPTSYKCSKCGEIIRPDDEEKFREENRL